MKSTTEVHSISECSACNGIKKINGLLLSHHKKDINYCPARQLTLTTSLKNAHRNEKKRRDRFEFKTGIYKRHCPS